MNAADLGHTLDLQDSSCSSPSIFSVIDCGGFSFVKRYEWLFEWALKMKLNSGFAYVWVFHLYWLFFIKPLPQYESHPTHASALKPQLSSAERKERWEQGQADYMGTDSFDNIKKKLDTFLK